jgi:hypothetical protein
MIARTALIYGNEKKALLNYIEASEVFRNQKNYVNLSICYNNIGLIHIKLKEFTKAV